VGNTVTIAKIVILLAFVGLGLELMLRRGGWRPGFVPFMAHGWGGVLKAMRLTFIAFQGFEVIAQCSEEIQNPKRNIPKAVFLSLAIVVPIYLLVAVASLGSVQAGSLTGGLTGNPRFCAVRETDRHPLLLRDGPGRARPLERDRRDRVQRDDCHTGSPDGGVAIAGGRTFVSRVFERGEE
jgi:amino acid transporter